jgi:hypothetical protein
MPNDKLNDIDLAKSFLEAGYALCGDGSYRQAFIAFERAERIMREHVSEGGGAAHKYLLCLIGMSHGYGKQGNTSDALLILHNILLIPEKVTSIFDNNFFTDIRVLALFELIAYLPVGEKKHVCMTSLATAVAAQWEQTMTTGGRGVIHAMEEVALHSSLMLSKQYAEHGEPRAAAGIFIERLIPYFEKEGMLPECVDSRVRAADLYLQTRDMSYVDLVLSLLSKALEGAMTLAAKKPMSEWPDKVVALEELLGTFSLFTGGKPTVVH